MNRNLFLAILNNRVEELDDRHKAAYMETALKILLDKPTWRERVECLKETWSETHTNQEIYRRWLRTP